MTDLDSDRIRPVRFKHYFISTNAVRQHCCRTAFVRDCISVYIADGGVRRELFVIGFTP